MKLDESQTLAYLARLESELGRTDHARLVTIAGLIDAAARHTSAGAVLPALFPASTSRESQNKTFTLLRHRFNELAETAGLAVRLLASEAKSEGLERAVWFEGEALLNLTPTTDELTRVGSRLIADTLGRPLTAHKPVVRWFLSYAHEDKQALPLAEALHKHLGNSRDYTFERWTDRDIRLGDHWHARIEAAISQCHLGVLLISQGFLASRYIRQHELPALMQGKRVIPVALHEIDFEHTDLRGLEKLQIFRDDDGRAFSERQGARKTKWMNQLVAQIHGVVAAYAQTAAASPAPQPESGAAAATVQMLSSDLDHLPHLLPHVHGRRTTLDERQLSLAAERAEPAADDNAVDVLQYLLEWAGDPAAPSLFALLGEYGMGKTISCQRLLRAIEQRRAAGDSTLPQPLYFDLRKLTGLRNGPVPSLDGIVGECVQRGWSISARQPAASELITRSRDHAQLWIFDGLDEALVHLSEVDGQAFTRELLRLQPLASHGMHAGTRVLISCRTHFFRSLQAQNNHFTGQRRDTTPASDYRALLMLPLDDAQVLSYFEHALPGLDAVATMEMVRSVHNLPELASRPYTLRLVSEFIPQLERWRAEGRPVYGVTLYRQMVSSWMQRDHGKHHLKPEHKERLMVHLAAWMWQRGQRLIGPDELEPWFHAWLDGQADLRLRYANVDRDKLEEDLRTATFLVREDEGDAGFRFAHSSMHEYFIAQHLFQAVKRGDRGAWAMPLVSRETRVFLSQLLLESGDAALVRCLSGWSAPYLAGASEQWLRYALDAYGAGWPAPSMAGADLSGANLHGWEFVGRNEADPMNLAGAKFVGCELRESVWRDVRLDGGCIDGAALDRCEWWRVTAPALRARGVSADGACFRRVQWTGSDWQGSSGHAPWFLFTEVPAAWSEALAPLHARTSHAFARARAAGGGPGSQHARKGKHHRTWAADAGHFSAVAACGFSPDGALVVSASDDHFLKLWDAYSGQCLATWAGHDSFVTACAFSPDGARVISASWDKSLKLWDAASGHCLATWVGHDDTVTACAFSPDGRRIVSASDDESVKLWDAASGHCLATWTGHDAAVAACAFSPDGTGVVSASDDHALKLWDATSGRCLATWLGHNDLVTACAFSPDGARVVSASRDNSLKLWDAASGRCLATWAGHDKAVTGCAFSPDGARVVSASDDNFLKLWDAASGQCLTTWDGHYGSVSACAFSPDGARVVSASDDHTLKLWDAASGQCLATWAAHDDWLAACAFSPDGARVVSASNDRSIKLWDAASGHCLDTWAGHGSIVGACAFSPDSTQVVSASYDNSLKLWEVASGRCLATWASHNDRVSACAFSPDGTRVVSASYDRSLKLWDAASGRCIATWVGHKKRVSSCAFSPDGARVVSASHDCSLKLWDAASGRCLATWAGHDNWVSACAFSTDGARIVSASRDNFLKLWDAASGRCIATWAGHESVISCCAYSPDGARVVSAGYDTTLKLWDAPSGQCLATWAGHDAYVTACAFSPDGALIASTAQDGRLILRDAHTGTLLRIHQHARGGYAVWRVADQHLIETSPDAWRWLVAQIHDDEGRLIDVLPAECLVTLPVPSKPAQR